MSTLLIYHHDERLRVENFCQPLRDKRYEFVFAPLGFQVGSDEWKLAFLSDLDSADAVIVFLTAKSIIDKAVAWRVEAVLNSGKKLLPIQLDMEFPSGKQWALPNVFQLFQRANAYNREGIVHDMLLSFLPPPVRYVFCFISYSRDDVNLAVRLKADLESRQVSTWRDVDDIPAGASWDNEIQKAINDCSHVLLIVTPRSVYSPNVADELSYARDKKKPILPLIFEEASLPLRIHRAQAIDFREDYGTAFSTLIDQLNKNH
jgi:hypothetical protein